MARKKNETRSKKKKQKQIHRLWWETISVCEYRQRLARMLCMVYMCMCSVRFWYCMYLGKKKISLLYWLIHAEFWLDYSARSLCSQYQLQSYFELNHDQRRSTLLSQTFPSSNPALSLKSHTKTSFTIVNLILFPSFHFFFKKSIENVEKGLISNFVIEK